MLDACYYSLIERAADGGFVGWVPDLPGVTARGRTEDEVVRQLSRTTAPRLRDLRMKGQELPRARPVDELPSRAEGREGRREVRRVLLILG